MIDATLDKINKFIPNKWQWVLNHEGFRRYFKNTGWMFFGQLFNIISVIIGIWLARYLGPENFGIFSYVLAFVGLFGFLANLGVNELLARDLVATPEKRDKLMGTAFIINLIGGFLAVVLTIFASQFLVGNNLAKILIAIWSTNFLISAFAVPSVFFRANVQAKFNSLTQIICIIVSSLMKVALIIFDAGIIWLMAIYIFDYIFGVSLYFYFYKKSGLNFRDWSFDKDIFKSFLSVSWLLMLSSVATSIYMKIDQVMIGSYLDNIAVGLYAAAVKLVEVWYFIPLLICNSLFPAIVNARKDSLVKYYDRLNNLYLLLFLLAIFIALPLSLISPWLVKILYGANYLGSITILQIYVWSGIGLFLNFGISQQLLVENRIKLLFILNLVGMVVNVILNIILIPKIGVNGAALATLVSYLIGPALFFLIKNKK